MVVIGKFGVYCNERRVVYSDMVNSQKLEDLYSWKSDYLVEASENSKDTISTFWPWGVWGMRER